MIYERFFEKEIVVDWENFATAAIQQQTIVPRSTMSVIRCRGKEYRIVLEVTPI
jgi:hypothetical protein